MLWASILAVCFVFWAVRPLNRWLDNKLCRGLQWVVTRVERLWCRLSGQHHLREPELGTIWDPSLKDHPDFDRVIYMCHSCYEQRYGRRKPDPLTKFIEEVERPD